LGDAMLGQSGEAEHQDRWPAACNPQRRDPLDGHATLGGGLDDGVLVVARGSSTYSWILARGVPAAEARYRDALFHLLVSETSCFRYWGQGTWTDYGAELSRRAIDIITRAF
jgi:hypothetical protein